MVTSFAALVMPQKLLQHSQSHTYKSMSGASTSSDKRYV